MQDWRVVGDIIELRFMVKLDYKPDRFKYIVKDNPESVKLISSQTP